MRPGDSTATQATATAGRRRASAFTLVEILVGLAIVGLLAVVVVPTIFARLQGSREDALVGEMQSLQNGIMLFYRDVGRYPLHLDYLNTLAAGSVDACGVAIPTPNVGNFRGPYINRAITMVNPPTNTKYLLSTGDSVETVLVRTTIATGTGTQRVLQILIYGPDQTTADDVDVKVDGIVGATTGIIHYTAASKILKWAIPINTNAC